MTKRELKQFLQDILDAIIQIENLTEGVNLEDFINKIEKFLAVVKIIEIIGEAVKQIPNNMRENYPEIPWKNIAGMRDKLIHEYWAIDEKMIWQVTQKNLPELKKIISKMIDELP